MKRLMVLLGCLCAVFLVRADVQVPAVRTVGMASGYRAAVNEALVSALEQHSGVTMSTSERQAMVHSDSVTSVRENGVLDDRAKLEMNDAINKDMQKWAKGKISGYTVLSDVFDPATKKYRVEVEVRFPPKYEGPGRPESDLRRMAVTPFNVQGNSFNWYGQPVGTVEWSAALAEQLNVRLTQTRKFSMLDRAFDPEINAELARLSAANAAPEDAARLNRKLGTDYLVVGMVKFNDVLPPAVNPFTGQPLPRASALFAEITYRVLIAPTGQLKWTNTIRLDAALFAAPDVRSFVSMSAEAAAGAICDDMMVNILPFEVVKVSPGQVVIGEGGKQLAVGDRFTVCALGEPVKDTRTGEVIDEVEIPVATVEVTAVMPKLSYAKIIEGDESKVTVGSRLRRVSPPEELPQQVPTTTTIQSNGGSGVVAPF
ncbi:MAG: hypothetical protein J6V72_06300 [Kiritimatiellae bacterium]|nr:hypothetical protein [Kiritimatiellia bacterium]